MYRKKTTAARPIFSIELTFVSPDTVVRNSETEKSRKLQYYQDVIKRRSWQ